MLVKLTRDIKLRVTMHQCRAMQGLEYGNRITKSHKAHKTWKCCLWGLEILSSFPSIVPKLVVKIKQNRPVSVTFAGKTSCQKEKERRRREFSTLTILTVRAEALIIMVIAVAYLCLFPVQLILSKRSTVCTPLVMVLLTQNIPLAELNKNAVFLLAKQLLDKPCLGQFR